MLELSVGLRRGPMLKRVQFGISKTIDLVDCCAAPGKLTVINQRLDFRVESDES